MTTLDNPIWNALVTRHAPFALGNERVKRYPADVAPFLATAGTDPATLAELAGLATPGEALYLIHPDTASPPPGWDVERRSLVSQMIWKREVGTGMEAEGDGPSILGLEDVPEMLDLTALAYPGYFRPRSIALGTFVGLRREGRLVAMAGLRMFPEGYREITAVCTHPDHRGRGHARRLIGRLVVEILGEGSTPFLHVDADNAGAKRVYESLGFDLRRDLSILRLRRL